MAFTIKRGDTKPFLRVQVQDEDSNAINLSNVSAVRFIADTDTDAETDLRIDVTDSDPALSIVDASNGIVEYEWQKSDTDTEGELLSEFEIEYSDGTRETFPNSGYILINIQPDLG